MLGKMLLGLVCNFPYCFLSFLKTGLTLAYSKPVAKEELSRGFHVRTFYFIESNNFNVRTFYFIKLNNSNADTIYFIQLNNFNVRTFYFIELNNF